MQLGTSRVGAPATVLGCICRRQTCSRTGASGCSSVIATDCNGVSSTLALQRRESLTRFPTRSAYGGKNSNVQPPQAAPDAGEALLDGPI